MAKALIGHLDSGPGTRLAAENARLRRRVRELEALSLRLSQENERLVAAQAAALLDLDPARSTRMQPA